jgi:pyochelin biosynthetic protein PchC
MNAEHRWLPLGAGRPDGEFTLLCFPHAGAHWSGYRDWEDELPGPLAIAPVAYPRASPTGALAFDNVGALAQAAYGPLTASVDRPIALYGHSLGALVAFELARLMTASGRDPVALVVTGRASPGTKANSTVHDLPSRDFWAEVESWGGVPAAILADPDARTVFEEALRADLRLAETWRPKPGPLLACPIVAIAGYADPLVAPGALEGWRAETAGPVAIAAAPGDHFFPFSHRAYFLGLLTRLLEDVQCRA